VAAVLRIVLTVLAVFAALWVAYELGTLIVMLVFSVLFAYLLAPIVGFVERRLLARTRRNDAPRGAAIAAAYIIVFGALMLLVAWIFPHVIQAARQVPQRIPSAALGGETFLYSWLRVVGVSGAMVDRAASMATNVIEFVATQVGAEFVHLASYLPWLVLVPILAFFFLKDARVLTHGGIEILPRRWRADAPALLDRVDMALAAYIRAQLVACVLIGAIVGLGFTALRVPFAAVLGVGAGLAEFVPLVGPLAVAAVSAGVAVMQSPLTAVWVLVFLGVLRVLEDYVIYPRLIGSQVHLHPLAVILAVLAGGELGGVVGVLLSVPCLAIAAAVYRHYVDPAENGATGSRSG
jgi:predicted PurR-regulated permease PerM